MSQSEPWRASSGERPARVKTKIVATVGPASDSPEMLRELICAGVDLFRFNFAHGAYEWLEGVAALIRRISAEMRRPIGILGDLSGPKIRLGELPGGLVECVEGERFEFGDEKDPEFPRRLTCSYEKLIDELRVGDRVLLADGTVEMRVVEKHEQERRVVCVVVQPGEIRSRQGLNLPGVALSIPSLTEKDLADLAWCVRNGLDYVGLSFVRSADDVRLLQQSIEALRPAMAPQIVAKIEKMEAVQDLERILELADAVMVARGDLGVEVDIARVPTLQKRIIAACNRHRIPVITATQMLDSMERNSRPTRAEASDVVNAVLDGSDAVMLSGETAIGKHAIKAVSVMSRLAFEAEQLIQPRLDSDPSTGARSRALAVTEAVTHGAGKTAELLGADLIVVATQGGKTALAVSKQRSRVPIVGLSDRPEIARRMCLYWGVTPLLTDRVQTAPQELLDIVVEWGRQEELLKSGSKLVLVANSTGSVQGHDLLLVHSVP